MSAAVLTSHEIDALVDAAISTLGRVLTSRMSMALRKRTTELNPRDLQRAREILTAGFSDELSGQAPVDPMAAENLKNYLNSPEFTNLLRHILTLLNCAQLEERLDFLRVEYDIGTELHGFSSPEDVSLRDDLFSILIEYLRKAWTPIQSKDSVKDQTVLIASYLAAIERHLEVISKHHKPALVEYNKFSQDLRHLIRMEVDSIEPPSFEERLRIPLDELYVAPLLYQNGIGQYTNGRAAFIQLDGLLKSFHRTVVLGDPGGGKSTLARRITLDIASGVRLFSAACAVELLPLMITIRDYAAFRREHGGSIVDYVEHWCRTTHQLHSPQGAIEWLVATGRTALIFDGLDELEDTSARLEITKSIESFGTLYPENPILVTSRRVGYREAPLNPAEYESYELGDFSPFQVKEYVTKWFLLDNSSARGRRHTTTEAFLYESRDVPDLCANPLLLALMCSVYRGEGYIPRNRPDLYEKCARMLFERWDRSRGIRLNVPFEAHLDATMKFLGYWIYQDSPLQSGVTETSLVYQASNYLERHLYSQAPAEAEHAARSFVEFCRGRAWVFTDVGTTSAGERLYTFTHRTFLEYFAASHLCRITGSSQELVDNLSPHLMVGQWDVVGQLAIHIFARTREGAIGDILRMLLEVSRVDESGRVRNTNILSFVIRTLAFLVPPRIVVEEVVLACLGAYNENAVRRGARRSDPAADMWLSQGLAHVAYENRTPITLAVSRYREGLHNDTALIERLIAVLASAGGRDDWLTEFLAADPVLGQDVRLLRCDALWLAAWSFLNNQWSAKGLVDIYGIPGLFRSPVMPIGDQSYTPIIDSYIAHFWNNSSAMRRSQFNDLSNILSNVFSSTDTIVIPRGTLVGAEYRLRHLTNQPADSNSAEVFALRDQLLAALMLIARIDLESMMGHPSEVFSDVLRSEPGNFGFLVPTFFSPAPQPLAEVLRKPSSREEASLWSLLARRLDTSERVVLVDPE